MPKQNKSAKMALKSKKGGHEVEARTLVIITGGVHRVAKAADHKAVCGVDRTGWHYGTESDVLCVGCGGEVEVPPVFPEDGEHHPNEETVPVLCFGCGEEWPCQAILAKLPTLSVEDFEKAAQ